jgi:bifunctional polynucleotide phosphatase/kinase
MNYLFTTPGTRLACFDLDGTLLKPKNGKKFAQDEYDAEYAHPYVVSTLKKLRTLGWKIVIFTNQKKSNLKDVPVEAIHNKVARMLDDPDHESQIDIFIAGADDYFRKPSIGMWDEFIKLNGPFEKAFYVGDAAGRTGDHAASDRQFAHNISTIHNTTVDFYTPEQFFAEDFSVPVPDYTNLPISLLAWPEEKNTEVNCTQPTVIILVGMPASGKSTFVESILERYPNGKVVSNDVTGSGPKSIKLFKLHIKNKCSPVIVDNTNPSADARRLYLSCIPNTYRTVCVNFALPIENCIHLSRYRAYQNSGTNIPTLVYRIFKGKYQKPKKSEGFHTIINYVPDIPEKIKQLSFH